MKIGDLPPNFSLPDQNGNSISLYDYRDKQNVVLFFYPRDDTPGWTIQVCEFRDMYQDFIDNDAVVIGISSDNAKSHKNFINKHKLPFPLLVDANNSLRKLWKVPKSLFVLAGRVTYIIDKTGTIRLIFNSSTQVKKHVYEALSILKQI